MGIDRTWESTGHGCWDGIYILVQASSRKNGHMSTLRLQNAVALLAGSTVTVLDLARNDVGDQGVQQIAVLGGL